MLLSFTLPPEYSAKQKKGPVDRLSFLEHHFEALSRKIETLASGKGFQNEYEDIDDGEGGRLWARQRERKGCAPGPPPATVAHPQLNRALPCPGAM